MICGLQPCGAGDFACCVSTDRHRPARKQLICLRRPWLSKCSDPSVMITNWIVLAAVGAIAATGADTDTQLVKDAQRAFKPLPKDAATAESPITPQRVELGRKLFFDP